MSMTIHQARRRPTADAVRAPYDVRTVLVRCPHDCTFARAPWGDRANIVRCPYSDHKNRTGIVRFYWGQNISKSHGDRTEIVRSQCGARTMLPTIDLQATMPTANRGNITPR